jgi:hypothetical protein
VGNTFDGTALCRLIRVPIGEYPPEVKTKTLSAVRTFQSQCVWTDLGFTLFTSGQCLEIGHKRFILLSYGLIPRDV